MNDKMYRYIVRETISRAKVIESTHPLTALEQFLNVSTGQDTGVKLTFTCDHHLLFEKNGSTDNDYTEYCVRKKDDNERL